MNVEAYIGKRWEAWARGPDAFDCWTLAERAALDLFGLRFPSFEFDHDEPVPVLARDYLAASTWQRVDSPRPGAVMACGTAGGIRHLALCLNEREALHIVRALRSCVVSIPDLALGFSVVRFYACPR